MGRVDCGADTSTSAVPVSETGIIVGATLGAFLCLILVIVGWRRLQGSPWYHHKKSSSMQKFSNYDGVYENEAFDDGHELEYPYTLDGDNNLDVAGDEPPTISDVEIPVVCDRHDDDGGVPSVVGVQLTPTQHSCVDPSFNAGLFAGAMASLDGSNDV